MSSLSSSRAKYVGDNLPAGVQPYRRTSHFTELTLPAALTSAHATKQGVWGIIHVVSGRLRYVVPATGLDHVLDVDTRGIIAPQQQHFVAPVGDVTFFVEFCK